jgi:hypothetical protein
MATRALSLLLCCAVVLGGCATLSEDECRSADWGEIGYADGREGEPRSLIEGHVESCAKLGIQPDRARYFNGRERGLREYCRAENGYRVGRAGESYHDVCPAALEPAFLERYRTGKRIHEVDRRISNLESERRLKETQLDKAKTDDERRRLRSELRNLDYSLRTARDELHFLQPRHY